MSDPAPLPPPSAPLSWRDRLDAAAHVFGVEPRRLLLFVGGAFVAVAVVVAVVVVRSLSAEGGAPAELTLPRAAPRSTMAGGSDPSSAVLVVAAAGAVTQPGVYRVPAGSRVVDVVDAAGGARADADVDQINLAAKVGDGDRVYVPRKGEAVPAASGPSGGSTDRPAIIDLNTATAAQLESLPGVGPATAQAILDYRAKRGRFRSVDELLEVRGIGEAKLAQLRPHVRVS